MWNKGRRNINIKTIEIMINWLGKLKSQIRFINILKFNILKIKVLSCFQVKNLARNDSYHDKTDF